VLTRDDIDVLPILPSLDIGETRSFYCDQLGMGVIYESADYLILRREAMELHFWLQDDRSLCERTAVYIRGAPIDELYRELSDRKVHKLSDFAVRPWDMKEFYVWDPHGNLLKFGRIPTDADRTPVS